MLLGELLENRLVKYKEMNLGANEIIDTGVNTGLIRFKINATSASCVLFCNSGSSNMMLITQNIEGGNLAASKIRNLECPSYEICLIDYGCGKFNRKIHIMEQYP